jgi:hypothetical protein
MDAVRYRSYVVRVWNAGPSEPAGTRIRVEWIAPGIEVEVRGERAADLAARLDLVFDSDPREMDDANPDHVAMRDRGKH